MTDNTNHEPTKTGGAAGWGLACALTAAALLGLGEFALWGGAAAKSQLVYFADISQPVSLILFMGIGLQLWGRKQLGLGFHLSCGVLAVVVVV